MKNEDSRITEFAMEDVMKDYRSGDNKKVLDAKEYVVAHYSGYVAYLIRLYYPTYVSKFWDDLFQSGNVGLLKALERYDPSVSSFTVYSKRYILHEVYEFICYIKNTTPYYDALQKKVRCAMEDTEGAVKPEEIAARTGMSVKAVKRELLVMNLRHISLDELRTM